MIPEGGREVRANDRPGDSYEAQRCGGRPEIPLTVESCYARAIARQERLVSATLTLQEHESGIYYV